MKMKLDMMSLLEAKNQLENTVILSANLSLIYDHLEVNGMLDCIVLVKPTGYRRIELQGIDTMIQ